MERCFSSVRKMACWFLAACSVLPLTAPDVVAQEKEKGAARTTFQFKDVAIAGARSWDDVYIRLTSAPVDDANHQQVIVDRPSTLKTVLTNLGKLGLNTTQTLMLSLDVNVGGQALGERPLLLMYPDDPTLGYFDSRLTPSFRRSDALTIKLVTRDTATATSGLVRTAVTALSDVTELLAPHGSLVKLVTNIANIDDKARSADNAIVKLFSTNHTQTTPPKNYDPALVDHFEIVADGKPLMHVRFESFETIFSDNGKSNAVPGDVAQIPRIQAKHISANKTIDQLFQDDSIGKALKTNTADGIQDFCSQAAQTLANLGFTSVDRAIAIYPYLYYSDWNSKLALRKSPDRCADETKPLDQTSLRLTSAEDLKKFNETDRATALKNMRDAKDGIFTKLAARFGQLTDQFWNSIVSDNMTFVSVGHDLDLGSLKLKAGIPMQLAQQDAQSSLQAVKFKYDKKKATDDGEIDDSCYSVDDTQTSSFKAFCFYPSSGTRPLQMEFGFNSTFDSGQPKLTTVKFYPRRDGAPL